MGDDTGEVKEVHSNGHTATFEWKIPDFSQLEEDKEYSSPNVVYFNREWFFGIRKTVNGIDIVSLSIDLGTSGIAEHFHFSIRCKTSDGEEIGAVREKKYPENTHNWDLDIDPPWRIPSSAGLTFTWTFRKGDSPHTPGVSRETQTEDTGLQGVSRETQTEGAGSRNDEHALEAICSQSEHFGKLLLSGDGHDVLLKVGDKQFRAHKHILKSRSPVFAAMFSHDMAESAGDSITIEDCDPDSFGQFLQFVYCGRADIASVSSALGLYHTGDMYDFPILKKMCVVFLESSFTTTSVFEVISLAARHEEKELLQRAIVYLSTHLKEVMRTVEWQRFLLANPIEANEMCLKALDCEKR